MEITNHSPVSLYVQLKELLTQEIRKQKLSPHDKIPSERELCEKYHLSRTTVRQGISLAVSEGLLYRIHGKGTFVAEQKINQGLISLTGFEETVMGRGLTPSMKVLEAQQTSADVHITSLLKLPLGADITSFKLLGIANNIPLALFHYYMPVEIGKEALSLIYDFEAKQGWFSFTRYFRELKKIELGLARQTFEATVASSDQSIIMQLAAGSALFKVTSIITTREEKPIELRHAFYRGDRYKFSISREVVS